MKLVAEPRARVVLYFPKLQEGQFPVWAPQDLFCIATGLMHQGYEVSLIDGRAPDADAELAAEIPGALFVGIGTKLGEQLRNALAAARRVKAARPELPVVLGGWFPSLFPDAPFDSADIDAVVIGPGDFIVPELADRLLAGSSLEGLTGVWARQGERIVKNPFGHLPDITKTHPIPYDLVGIQRYMHPHGWINTFTSRGCPGECNFCSIYCLDPKRWVSLPAERVVDDMERLTHLGFRAFKVMDTDFCANPKRVQEICRLIAERGLEVRFEVLGRHWNLRSMSDEEIRDLRRAGCTEIEMGIESGSQRMSDLVRKKLDVTEVPGTVRRFVRGGIRMKLNFMFGIPSETKPDLTETLLLIDRLLQENGDDAVRLQLFRYTPLPGAAAKDDVWKPKVGETERLSLTELADYPVVEDEPGPMPWITPAHARIVKLVYYLYAPLAFLPAAIEPARLEGRWLYYRWLKLLRPLARWRLRNGVYAFPFERWWNDRFGFPFRHGSDDGLTGPDDVLPPPEMGQRFDTRAPLQPVAG